MPKAKAIAVRGYLGHSAKAIATFGYFGTGAVVPVPDAFVYGVVRGPQGYGVAVSPQATGTVKGPGETWH